MSHLNNIELFGILVPYYTCYNICTTVTIFRYRKNENFKNNYFQILKWTNNDNNDIVSSKLIGGKSKYF